MEQVYKGNRIEFAIARDGDGWFANVFIYYSKGPRNILATFALPGIFKTHAEATEASLTAAHRWIDAQPDS
jgi:hypothetical protein